MKVRQLVGAYAGHIVDMPQDVAESCISCGTACHVGEEPRVRGLTMVDPDDKEERAVQPPVVIEKAPPPGTDPDPEPEPESEPEPKKEPAPLADVDVPSNWRSLHHTERKRLGAEIFGDTVATAEEADFIIAAYVKDKAAE